MNCAIEINCLTLPKFWEKMTQWINLPTSLMIASLSLVRILLLSVISETPSRSHTGRVRKSCPLLPLVIKRWLMAALMIFVQCMCAVISFPTGPPVFVWPICSWCGWIKLERCVWINRVHLSALNNVGILSSHACADGEQWLFTLAVAHVRLGEGTDDHSDFRMN